MSSRSDYRWIAYDVVLAVHEAQISEHGGSAGVRDPGRLAAALARPRDAAAYGKPDVPELAALYAIGVIRNHPFMDGNKRVGTVLLDVFLEDNGFVLDVGDKELIRSVMDVASSTKSEAEFIAWVRAHAKGRGRR